LPSGTETTWNVDGRIQGIWISPERHRPVQAEQAAQALADESIAAIYSSDLQRAHVTAQAIAQRSGAPLHTTAGLRERCFGDFQGRTFKDVEATQPEDAQLWRTRNPAYARPAAATRCRPCANASLPPWTGLHASMRASRSCWSPMAA
jgi:probable phosphoglycerate mutase